MQGDQAAGLRALLEVLQPLLLLRLLSQAAALQPSEPARLLIPGAGLDGPTGREEGVPPGGLPERRRRRSSGSGNSRPRAFTSPGVKAGPLPRPLP